MFAKDFIDRGTSILTPNDTLDTAIRIMDELKVNFLPVVEEGYFWGLLSEATVLEEDMLEESICLFPNLLKKVFVFDDQHIYTAFNLAHIEQINMIPVVDKEFNYFGVITAAKMVDAAAMLTASNEEGGVLMLQMNANDLYVSEIARLIEENDAKIINLYITPHKHSTQIDVTIKINKIDLYRIAQTLERYDYKVKVLEEQSDLDFDTGIADRYNLFMKYLSI